MNQSSHENRMWPYGTSAYRRTNLSFYQNLFRNCFRETLLSIYRRMSTFATTSKRIEKQLYLPVGLGLLAFWLLWKSLSQRHTKQMETKPPTPAKHSDDVGTVAGHPWLSLKECLPSASTTCSSLSSYSKHALLGLILPTITQ